MVNAGHSRQYSVAPQVAATLGEVCQADSRFNVGLGECFAKLFHIFIIIIIIWGVICKSKYCCIM